MKKTLQELTTELQTLCHEGHANDEVAVQILDSYYQVGRVQKVSIEKNGNVTKVLFAIEAKTA